MGAKLLTLVYRAQDSNNAELARSALQDLRDVVSRAGTEHIPLTDAMADYRIECEKRLSDVHIQLVWQIEMKADHLLLTQPQVLNLGRIIREAVSNVIRHAQASQVTVNLSSHESHLSLTVSDNGIGLPTQSASNKGRGLHNIQKRATLLGGEVHFAALTTGGLKLCLQLPLHAFAQAPH